MNIPKGPFLNEAGQPSLEWLVFLIGGNVTNTTASGLTITPSTTVEPTHFQLNPTGVTAGASGDASHTFVISVNASGQVTDITPTSIAIANTQVSGLGTMATQNASSVAIGGGSINATAITNGSISGATAALGQVGFNGNSLQSKYASGGAVAATGSTNSTPYGYTTSAQADGIVTLLNNIRIALINVGIMS